MKIEDLEKWIETEEGENWLNEKKKPLIEKKEQLLSEIAIYKKRLTEATEQGNALDGKVKNYLENLKKAYCQNCFDDVNTFNVKVFDDKELRAFILNKIETMAEADGGLIPDIDDNGQFKFATADGKDFKEYYKEWTGTEGAKSFIQNLCTGGGARGCEPSNSINMYSKETIKRMTPEQVAENLDNPTFRNSIN